MRREARRAGRIAAITPTITETIAKMISDVSGTAYSISNCDSAFVTSAARNIPSGSPSAAPMRAVITLSCRIIRRTWSRVIPTALSIPSSRVRSKTLRTSVLIIPKMLTITDRASRT